ncbi:Respiratory burst oxidase D [Hibiscus syriacus]|uniref:Respiratory burst oxidase D n=1 Tax=Hibiscus syriacus TaxID=106335 RepID=A0A6A3BF86_HIBSY|nr:Respiratory burst oxidase D [Hibiscus syriacus]
MFSRWSNSHHSQENDSLQHESKVKELRAAVGPLAGRSLKYCTDACLRKYLEHGIGTLISRRKCWKRLKWRSTYKPEEIRWDEVAVDGEIGKVYRANFHDRSGRIVLILRPGKQNTKSLDNQQRHLVYMIENAILNLPEGQQQRDKIVFVLVCLF